MVFLLIIKWTVFMLYDYMCGKTDYKQQKLYEKKQIIDKLFSLIKSIIYATIIKAITNNIIYGCAADIFSVFTAHQKGIRLKSGAAPTTVIEKGQAVCHWENSPEKAPCPRSGFCRACIISQETCHV